MLNETDIREYLYDSSGLTPIFNPTNKPKKITSPVIVDLSFDMTNHTRFYHSKTDAVRLLIANADAVVCENETLVGVARKFTNTIVAPFPFGFCPKADMQNDDGYNFTLHPQGDTIVIDWESMIHELMQDDPPIAAIRFHNTLTEIILKVAQQIGIRQVALTGGCFQNRYLTEHTIQRLRENGFDPYWHHHIPPNDGGISVGQSIGCDYFLTTD